MSEKPSNKIPTHDYSPQQSVDLYAKRKKVQPRSIKGFFQNIRHLTISAALGIYLLLPWLTWDGRQALLFDLPNRKFYIFGWTFLPQDFIFLSWLLIMAAFSLFALTVFAGRVFCGYTCPQTIWTKLFMMVEHLTEGERNARLRMDKASLSLGKVLRRGSKHVLWLAIAFITAITFVSYFSSARELTESLLSFSLGPWEFFWIFFFTAATYINAGWMREQVCLYMCPYGRFQSVMMDHDTLIISYDRKRGDPRGSRKRDAEPALLGLGDCVDCELCVQVCPTGIDIRNGLQFECIQCAACIDACDSIMDQMGYSRGLVRYTTENILERGGKYHLLRFRLIGYLSVIAIMAGLFLFSLSMRVPLEVETVRDRNMLYRETNQGMIENSYLLKVQNKSQTARDFRLTLEAPSGIQLEDNVSLHALPGEQVTLPVTLRADPAQLEKRKYDVVFHIQATDDAAVQKSSENRFLAPGK